MHPWKSISEPVFLGHCLRPVDLALPVVYDFGLCTYERKFRDYQTVPYLHIFFYHRLHRLFFRGKQKISPVRRSPIKVRGFGVSSRHEMRMSYLDSWYVSTYAHGFPRNLLVVTRRVDCRIALENPIVVHDDAVDVCFGSLC